MQPYFVYLMIVFCGLFSVNPSIAAKRIALSFDDAPHPVSFCLDGVTCRHLLLEQLKMHAKAPAIFMVTTKHLAQQGAAVLEVLAAAGQLLGNHSHSHLRRLRLVRQVKQYKTCADKLGCDLKINNDGSGTVR